MSKVSRVPYDSRGGHGAHRDYQPTSAARRQKRPPHRLSKEEDFGYDEDDLPEVVLGMGGVSLQGSLCRPHPCYCVPRDWKFVDIGGMYWLILDPY